MACLYKDLQWLTKIYCNLRKVDSTTNFMTLAVMDSSSKHIIHQRVETLTVTMGDKVLSHLQESTKIPNQAAIAQFA
jgi:hypothetical protein